MPTISGTVQVGETLTADTAALEDEDGLDDVSYEYQWIAGGTDINGATSSTYELTSSEQGQTIEVKVTFTDDANNEETLTSEATDAVAAKANTAPTGLPTITGTAQVGETLTADTSTIEDEDGLENVSYTYQWIAGGTDIEETTGSSYELTSSEQGQTIQVRVTFTDDDENEQTLTSTATDAVAAKANTAPTGLPTITGTAQVGETLAADTSAIDDEDGLENVSYEYQWIAGGTDIDGATSSSYEPTSSERGQTIQVQVTFTDDAENEETLTSAATAAVAAKANTAPTGLPTITGTPQVGEMLTADTSAIEDEDGLEDVAYEYQWIAGGTDIEETTGSSYELTSSEQGQTIQVRVTFSDDDDNAETLTSEATEAVAAKANTAPTGLPTITGMAQVGETLTADTANIADEDGLEDVSYTYRWIAGGTDIDGATGSSYLLTSNEQGQTIQVKVTFADDAENEETLTSVATEAVAAKANTAPTGLPTITGTAQVGETLTSGTSAIADEDGLTNVSYEYQWIAGGTDIDGATGSSYLLTSNEQGQTIQVKVTFTDDAENEETLTSAATEAVAAKANTAATGLPTITGTAQVGETLTADTSAIEDEDGLDDVSHEYQWIAGGTDIDGATGSSYLLTSNEQGQTIQVKVTFTDDAENEETLTSAATEAVAAKANTAPTGLPTITGTAQAGETLTSGTSAIADEDGLTNVSYEYQWIAGGTDIDGATGSSYTLTASELGKTIQVRVTFTDDAENEETLTSAATEAVAAKANTAPTGLPTITGTAQAGETLTSGTSAIADEDGLTNVSYEYQWIAGGTDIDGATSSSYELTSSEQGKTVKVKVTFTDDAENEETLTSAATAAVAAKANTAPTGLPTITGTAQVGETLTSGTSAIADEDGLTNVSYEYQWIAGGTDIDGATGSSYLLTSNEQGQTIQVKVTFTDDAENEETLTSEATVEVSAAPVPLTVSVTVSAPGSHDGSSAFIFEIEFSEEFGVSYRTLKFDAFNVTGGSVEKAQRTDKPSNIPWRIEIKPQGNGDVTIELPATTDCNADGAICTGDGRKLSNSLSFTVSGPGG